MFPSIIEYNMN